MENTRNCPYCKGEAHLLGGDRVTKHWRCQNCGTLFTVIDKEAARARARRQARKLKRQQEKGV